MWSVFSQTFNKVSLSSLRLSSLRSSSLRFARRGFVARRLAMSLAAVCLLTLSAKVQIPFYPVPMTLQTMALMLIGCFLARPVAMMSVVSYVLLGALGLPLFAKGGGLPYLLGPTGGYILGFVPAMWLFATLRRSVFGGLAQLVAGVAVVYACGLAWLGFTIGWDKPLLALGFLPFVLGDAAKVAIVSGVCILDKSRVRRATRAW